jgi:ATP-binding protein involved in chromosome partitioning
VTTPQEAARKVAERAGKMAGQARLKVLGVVENMSYFICPSCNDRHEIFGSGGGAEAAETLDVPLLGQVPLVNALREGGDSGTPIVVSDPDSPASVELRSVASQLAKLSRSRVGKPLGLTVAGGAPAGAGAHAGHAH